MLEKILELFNTAQGKSYALDDLVFEDMRPAPAGSQRNTLITVRTSKKISANEQWSITFGYDRVHLSKIAQEHPNIVAAKGEAWVCEIYPILRATWDLMVNPNDFQDVNLPLSAGKLHLIASIDSLGVMGSGEFNFSRS